MGKVWEATQTWERLENRLGKVREGKVLHGKTLGRVWEEVLFIVVALTEAGTRRRSGVGRRPYAIPKRPVKSTGSLHLQKVGKVLKGVREFFADQPECKNITVGFALLLYFRVSPARPIW